MQTALVMLIDDPWWKQDGDGAFFFLLFDFSVTFDTIDHYILLD